MHAGDDDHPSMKMATNINKCAFGSCRNPPGTAKVPLTDKVIDENKMWGHCKASEEVCILHFTHDWKRVTSKLVKKVYAETGQLMAGVRLNRFFLRHQRWSTVRPPTAKMSRPSASTRATSETDSAIENEDAANQVEVQKFYIKVRRLVLMFNIDIDHHSFLILMNTCACGIIINN